nr:hypothetical protein [Tanacetum cinerariifolium]
MVVLSGVHIYEGSWIELSYNTPSQSLQVHGSVEQECLVSVWKFCLTFGGKTNRQDLDYREPSRVKP